MRRRVANTQLIKQGPDEKRPPHPRGYPQTIEKPQNTRFVLAIDSRGQYRTVLNRRKTAHILEIGPVSFPAVVNFYGGYVPNDFPVRGNFHARTATRHV